ncbi:MAG: hypothetical protein MUD04_05450 [Cyanobium sp. Prado107]|jgi:hypothetical protein|nr:hypothetical protein [Cyanobium sp. Prado107]
MPADLWIANTVCDLIQGDVREHLPLERIPLRGDVLGLGTTTSLDNGELTFLHQEGGDTTIWKSEASSGGIHALRAGDGSGHFPYVCFSGDATAVRTPLDPAALGDTTGRSLQELVGEAIALMRRDGALPEAPIYGLRLLSRWQGLVITVASKLCMGQQRRNTAIARSAASEATASRSIYQLLQHYRLAPRDPGDPADPVRYLGRSLRWECCGFYDTEPQTGRVTVPQPDAHLHLHGCSTDLRYGGHLHHEHPESKLAQVERLVLYPLRRIHSLASDLGVDGLRYHDGAVQFRVINHGGLDVSDVGVAVVLDDRYSSHRYLRLPWLAAGEAEAFSVPLTLAPGRHRLEVIADPQREILERPELQVNNRELLEVEV